MPENYSFSVVLEPQPDGGFSVLVPALPEVVTEGDDEQEALNMRRKPFVRYWNIVATRAFSFRPTQTPKRIGSDYALAPFRLPAW